MYIAELGTAGRRQRILKTPASTKLPNLKPLVRVRA
jgi:hypothetical protein